MPAIRIYKTDLFIYLSFRFDNSKQWLNTFTHIRNKPNDPVEKLYMWEGSRKSKIKHENELKNGF